MSEFKGTPAPWKLGHEKYYNGNKAFEIHYGNDGECVSEVVHRVEDAQLIAHALEMFNEIKETVIDLKILRNQILHASKSNHLFDGMPELIDKWIQRKEQLIQKAITPCETK